MHTVLIYLSRFISRKLKKQASLSLLRKELNLAVTKQENLRNQFIGFDRLKRKLLLVRKQGNRLVCCIVNLQDLQWCSVKKVYNAIGAGELKGRSLNHHLQSVSLQLGFKGNTSLVSVPFFESRHHTVNESAVLEAAANRWARFLSQLLPKPLLSVAG